MARFDLALLTLLIGASASVSSTVHPNSKRHASAVAAYERGEADSTIQERGIINGKATYFYQGGQPGACGKVHPDKMPLVAISSKSFNQGLCGKQVEITYKGKKKQAVVADECPPCEANHIDLSTGAFEALASMVLGEIDIQWQYLTKEEKTSRTG